jgi:hypothetical protein
MTNYIQEAKEKLKLDYINSDITIENFPEEKVREGFKIFHFGEYLTTEEVVSKLDKEGYQPANLAELLTYKEWNGKDFVVALGSVWQNRSGGPGVVCLWSVVGRRGLDLRWTGYRWYSGVLVAGVRKSLKPGTSDSLDSVTPDSLETRIKVLEKFKDKIERIINL